MIPIKIQCGCGQRYAFEVEPVAGQVPAPVACPACGAEGTAAANAAIAQSLAGQPAVAVAGRGPLRVAAPARATAVAAPAAAARPAPRRSTTVLPGQIDHTQAKYEARAKILWGDPPEEVTRYLMIQGFSPEEASSLVEELFRERAASIRAKGIVKIVFGAALICVPIAAFFTFMAIGYFLLKTFAVTVMVGFWGIWLVIKGGSMALAPKSEPGDVAEQ